MPSQRKEGGTTDSCPRGGGSSRDGNSDTSWDARRMPAKRPDSDGHGAGGEPIGDVGTHRDEHADPAHAELGEGIQDREREAIGGSGAPNGEWEGDGLDASDIPEVIGQGKCRREPTKKRLPAT
jgi:hypothetical protein